MRFRTADPDERRRAIGDLGALPPVVRRAFEPDEDFEPLPAPAPGDWLSVAREPRQSFDTYARTTTNKPDASRRTLYLCPVDEYPADALVALEELQTFADAFFRLPVVTLEPLHVFEGGITVRENRFTGVTQLLTRDVLRKLSPRVPADACCMLGITRHDLYPHATWSFVFGEAILDERVGIFSVARLDPRFYDRPPEGARDTLVRRCCKVLAHEACHMLGLRHCTYFRCLMNGSNHLDESDRRPLHLCPVDLRKLHWAVGFDIVERYERLLAFWRRAGVQDEARWLERRVSTTIGARHQA